MKFLASLRMFFTAGQGVVLGTDDANELSDPISLFDNWFRVAEKSGVVLPESMTLSTATADGKPSSRMVLLKSYDEEGFVFFTNYRSRKATELISNPHAALLFHWGVLQRQVRVEGSVEKVSPEESDAYFASRGRGSQIGAWASKQSKRMVTKSELEERVQEIEERFRGQSIARPPHWGGFRVRPEKIEFWQGKMSRLHDRMIFTIENERWTGARYYP
jgi:pyridoxamine 5'-phosphate oxidase